MPVSETIFNKMTAENENAVTELLVNLMRKKYLRDIILDFLLPCENGFDKKKVIESVKFTDIKTQQKTDYGIPDILIENENCFVIIENKIRYETGFQENQIDNYPELVKLHQTYTKNCAYIFLLPKGYDASAIKQINASYKQFIIKKQWSDLLQYISKLGIENDAPAVKDALEYFRSVIDSSIVLNTLLTPLEVTMVYSMKELFFFAGLAEKCKTIFPACIDRLTNAGIKKKDWQCNQCGIGQHFMINENWLFLGFSAINEPEYEKFCFSLCIICKNEELGINKKKLSESGVGYKENEDYYIAPENASSSWICFPLDRKLLAAETEEEQISSLVSAMNKYLDVILK